MNELQKIEKQELIKLKEAAKRAAKFAEENAKREKLSAIEAAKQAEIQARKNAEEAARIAAEAKAAEAKDNKENIKARCEAALASLLSQPIDGLNEKQARKIITAIHRGLVDNVSIQY